MVQASDIQKHMEVRGADGSTLGVVDSIDGDRIKLTRKDSPDGEHHYLDVSDVQSVDEHVHLSGSASLQ